MSTPENYQRAEDLRNMVLHEIEDLKLGERSKLSSLEELREVFGYRARSSVYGVLDRVNLLNARRLTELEIMYTLSPSIELAWIMGLLAGGGIVGKKVVGLYSDDDTMRYRFKSRGERIFQVTAKEGKESITYSGKTVERPTVYFYNRRLSRALGDLRQDKWPDTVWSMHSWICGQDRYGWSFLEGFFETRGGVYERRLHRYLQILIMTSSRKSANFLTELMVRLGLENPTVRTNPSTKEGIDGIALYKQSDIKKFAENVYPVNPDKAAKFSQIRNMELYDRRGRTILYPDEQVIEEWIKARDLLDHPPTILDIERLRKEGILRCSHAVFEKRFGDGSFRRARENLEKIVEDLLN